MSKRFCLIEGCNLPFRAKNMCNKHYLQEYFRVNRGGALDRGQRYFRRNSIAYEVHCLTGIPFEDARRIVRIIFNKITEGLKNGEEVRIPGFGVFGIHNRPVCVYGSPVYFWPSKELKEMVRFEHAD